MGQLNILLLAGNIQPQFRAPHVSGDNSQASLRSERRKCSLQERKPTREVGAWKYFYFTMESVFILDTIIAWENVPAFFSHKVNETFIRENRNNTGKTNKELLSVKKAAPQFENGQDM